ncbi:MAG: RNA polymerase subunit sigma-70 [Chloroflexi bacterium]|nr:RNA polymerase subunit sigma-70 [Chloroflexota bacterium]MDL1911416.1 sigma-70 family RNA polymerase sigma factor [Chloroflexi bacterium CFX6]
MKKFGYWVSEKIMTAADGKQGINDLRDLDSQAIGAVYDQYFSEVYRYALYRLGDQSLAEDIASDVFIRLLEAVRSGRGPDSNLKGWLIGTANHIVTDHIRRKYRRSEEEIPESLPDLQPGPASEVDQREQNRAVQNAYTKLTPEQQHVLALRFGQGYSLEETAVHLNKNVNAVKALQFRALAALQREIGEVDYE